MRRFSPPALASLPLCLAAINFFSNFAGEISNVYIALYARDIGASNMQVGLIAAGMGISFLVSSLWFGRLSDIHGRIWFIRVGLGLASLSFLTQVFSHSPMALLAARSFVGFCGGIAISALMAYTYEHQKQIGNFVSYGSLGWLFGAMAAPLVKDYEGLFLISAAASAMSFIISFFLKGDEPAASRIRVTAFSLRLMKENYKVYIPFFLRQLGGFSIWPIFPLFLTSIGASKLWISIIDATNMLGQFISMRIVERYNPVKMFQMGLVMSVVVYAVYGIVNHYLQIIPIQLMLALAYSTMFIGALSYLMRQHQERGTVAGFMNSTMSLSSSIGPFLGGAVSQAWGYTAVMFVGSGIAAIACLFSWGLKTKTKTQEAD